MNDLGVPFQKPPSWNAALDAYGFPLKNRASCCQGTASACGSKMVLPKSEKNPRHHSVVRIGQQTLHN